MELGHCRTEKGVSTKVNQHDSNGIPMLFSEITLQNPILFGPVCSSGWCKVVRRLFSRLRQEGHSMVDSNVMRRVGRRCIVVSSYGLGSTATKFLYEGFILLYLIRYNFTR